MSQNNTKKIAVIGAGPMGLLCTYELLKRGFQVTLYERDDRIGGMSASFDLDGTKIERFYHFICATDYTLFDLLKELNLSHKLQWKDTRMGFYYEGKLYPWGDPVSLLKFPKLSLISKLRYGAHVAYTKSIKNWNKLDRTEATQWLKKWIGRKAYDVLWKSLFEWKFYEYQTSLSAAWLGARIQRVAKSRKSVFQEQLGYLEGGSDTLLYALQDRILELGGKIELNAQVQEITAENNKVTGIIINNTSQPCHSVISTIPLPYVANLVPALPTTFKNQIASIKNVGVACVVLKLKQPLSPYFWMNINDSAMEIPGVIEYSNLNPMDATNILYVPYYMPSTYQKYKQPNQFFINEVSHYLKSLNPNFSSEWILSSHVARYEYAQTVCTPDFFQKLPPMKTPLAGFYMADTSYYYPEDRCISESMAVGHKLVNLLMSEI